VKQQAAIQHVSCRSPASTQMLSVWRDSAEILLSAWGGYACRVHSSNCKPLCLYAMQIATIARAPHVLSASSSNRQLLGVQDRLARYPQDTPQLLNPHL
jgi:hypothetical protein